MTSCQNCTSPADGHIQFEKKFMSICYLCSQTFNLLRDYKMWDTDSAVEYLETRIRQYARVSWASAVVFVLSITVAFLIPQSHSWWRLFFALQAGVTGGCAIVMVAAIADYQKELRLFRKLVAREVLDD